MDEVAGRLELLVALAEGKNAYESDYLGEKISYGVERLPASITTTTKVPAIYYYTDYNVTDEVLDFTGGMSPEGWAGPKVQRPVALAYAPIVPQSLVLTDGKQVLFDNGLGMLTGDGGGRINYESGLLEDVFFNEDIHLNAPTAMLIGKVVATYSMHLEHSPQDFGLHEEQA